MKYAEQIKKWGRIKPFFDKIYSFNTLDLETINNELFLIGVTLDGKHHVIESDFYHHFHIFLIKCLQSNKDVLTWTRYDNTHLLKLILSKATPKQRRNALLRVGKVGPIYEYDYGGFHFKIVNIIRNSIIIENTDRNDHKKTIILYDLKALFDKELTETAKDYGVTYYSKIGMEYHIIEEVRYHGDKEYHDLVIESNRLDNMVLLDIANKMLEDFKTIAGTYPKTIYSNGSLARSYLLSNIDQIGAKELNFKSMFGKNKYFRKLLDYSMRSYHGGKIESYVLGYIPKAKVIDITSAYPWALTQLPRITSHVIISKDLTKLEDYFYAFIKCNIHIKDQHLIHPCAVESPLNKTNLSPYGYFTTVITKPEYDYLKKRGVGIDVIDYVAVEHIEDYPYQPMIQKLFEERMKTKKSNPSLSQMYKIILNSMYGITYELGDQYEETEKGITWTGYRAGDFFHPVIASYITALVRTYLSEVSQNIRENGGQLFLNMTDSVIYEGTCTLDVFSDTKILGKFEPPTPVEHLFVLGAGRYEYKDEFTQKFTIKSRGFSVARKDTSFYGKYDLNKTLNIGHRSFITSFKATTKKYAYEKMGYLIDDDYEIDPFNMGGKRIIDNPNVNLNQEYTTTSPVYLEEGIIK